MSSSSFICKSGILNVFVTSFSTIPLLRSCVDLHGFSKGITELLTLFTTSALDLHFRLGFFL